MMLATSKSMPTPLYALMASFGPAVTRTLLVSVFSTSRLTPLSSVTLVCVAKCLNVALNSLVEYEEPSILTTVPVGMESGETGLTVRGAVLLAACSGMDTSKLLLMPLVCPALRPTWPPLAPPCKLTDTSPDEVKVVTPFLVFRPLTTVALVFTPKLMP